MLKRALNRAVVEMIIQPIDPLLIKSGQATVSGVDMSFVKTYRNGQKPEPFIPGSSLKGVIRAYAEMICRTLRATPVPVCQPYMEPGKEKNGESGQAACGLRINGHLERTKQSSLATSEVYRLSCPACRTFGSHHFIGRLATADGYLTDDFKKSAQPLLETRDGVAIDRLTGGAAKGAKYDLEVLTKGQFGTRIEILNFERWQLGLLGLILRDMEEGLVRIGMGKSRGLGRISATVNRFQIAYYATPQVTLTGLAAACTQEEREAYGLFSETTPGHPLPENRREGLRYTYDVTSTWREALESAVEDLVAYIDEVQWPQKIDDLERRW
jgi:CRISPR-associated RAMP protein (TIGR02581 family)